jgi:sulfur-carrier protein
MKILYFAWVREAVGKPEEDLNLPEGVASVSDLVAWLKQQDTGYETAFANNAAVRVAVNQEYVDFDHGVSNGDEIAFFPPVTGG